MGLPGRCYYVGQVGEQARALAGVVQDFFTSGWEPLVRGGIDGYNISEFLIDKRCGLEWDYAAIGRTGPKKLCAPALSETAVPAMRRKGPTNSDKRYGLEFVVDPTGPGSTYGRACIVASTDLSKQIISFVPEDPKTAANPTGSVLANYGKGIFGTSGAFNWEMHRSGSASLADDGSALGTTRTLFRLGTLASSASFPALKRNGAALEARLGDDAGPTSVFGSEYIAWDGTNQRSTLQQGGVKVPSNGSLAFSQSTTLDDADAGFTRGGDGKIVLSAIDGASTAPMLQLGGTSSSYPALKRSSTALEAKLADDSAYAPVSASAVSQYLGTAYKFTFAGTPATSDKTHTLPNRSGTVTLGDGSLGLGEIPEGDANGDLTASGITSGDITRLYAATTQTGADAGNYAVAATVGTVFVNASAVTTNYDVTLPSAVTYANRRVTVKITVVGGGGSTVTVKSAAGTVEGVAAATGVALDATARSKVTYQSDGTNWWNVGS